MKREVAEETIFSVTQYSNVRCYDSFVQCKDTIVHHIFVLYNIDIKLEKNNHLELVDEKNDSLGSSWIDIKNLNLDNSSPIILKLLEEMENKSSQTLLDVTSYKNWNVR